MRAFRGDRVYLNVYDLSPANNYVHDFGVGVYHSGVSVGSTEYTFGGHEGSSTGGPKIPRPIFPMSSTSGTQI